MKVIEIYNSLLENYISQNAPDSYSYTVDFAEIDTYINTYYPSYQLIENSFMYITAEYDSILLRYPMGHTPFNYDYLGSDHYAYHIALYINGEFIAYSNETVFDNYVLKVEDNYIYFNNKSQGQPGYIAPNSEIQLTYKFKVQPGLLDRKHFLIVTYPWTNVFDTPYNPIVPDDQITYREKYRKLSGGSIITPFEYSLSIENRYSLYLSYRLNQREYYEEQFEIKSEHFSSAEGGYVYEFMFAKLDNYIDVLEVDGQNSVNVFYFDPQGKMTFLDASHYIVNVGSRQIIIKNDGNELVAKWKGLNNFRKCVFYEDSNILYI